MDEDRYLIYLYLPNWVKQNTVLSVPQQTYMYIISRSCQYDIHKMHGRVQKKFKTCSHHPLSFDSENRIRMLSITTVKLLYINMMFSSLRGNLISVESECIVIMLIT